ncbi:DP-EP family protein [Shewanella abyssi]|uniref:DP-EP family protein n=1 Tax=Shewanella abyssi TaxID=311789 RepID=UPI00200C7471|nr:DP-EP family protein [Shewanella abyssi]MCL1048647.1 DP-EP family protein [Shewanella abyssi]
MSDTSNIVEFNLIVTLANNVPEFNYTDINNQPVTGDFIVTQEQTITYKLIDNTDRGLKFVGAAFERPFNKVIDDVWLQGNGQQINLLDLDKIVGKASFRFVLSNSQNSLMLLSPDPVIISRGQT